MQMVRGGVAQMGSVTCFCIPADRVDADTVYCFIQHRQRHGNHRNMEAGRQSWISVAHAAGLEQRLVRRHGGGVGGGHVAAMDYDVRTGGMAG